jgi:vacuolar-type H+-ATPase subunit C/Vma6
MITINSFGTELTKEDRFRLLPKCGKLYPDGLVALAKAEDYEQVRAVAENYGVRPVLSFFTVVSLSTNHILHSNFHSHIFSDSLRMKMLLVNNY